jgi:hypothetical protein
MPELRWCSSTCSPRRNASAREPANVAELSYYPDDMSMQGLTYDNRRVYKPYNMKGAMQEPLEDDKEHVKEVLLTVINAARDEIDVKRREIANLAAYRARCVHELREYFTAAEIAHFLGISRQAVHAMISESDPELGLSVTPPGLEFLFKK